MSGNQLAKFFATVGFKADLTEFDAAVKKIKRDVAGIATNIRGSSAVKRTTALTRARDKVKAETSLLEASKIKSLRLVESQKPRLALTDRRISEVNARTAQINARTATTHARTQMVAGNLSLQNARNEAIRLRTHMRSTMGMRQGSGAGNAALTGGVGGLSARGAGGALAAGAFATQSFKVGNFMMSRKPQFEFLTGSAEEAAKQIRFVDEESKRLSLDLVQANEQYKQLLASGATSIGIEKTQKLFSGFSEMSTMMGLSADAQNRGMRAFAQIMSKSKIMSEEVKGQLAEALPNAVGIFADALYGDGTAGSGDKAKFFKDMELGKLGLEELTKVIDYMQTLTKKDLLAQMLNTPAKKFTAMKNQLVLMLEALNDAGVLDLMIKVFEEVTLALSSLSKIVRDNKETFKEFGKIVGKVWGTLKVIISGAWRFISNVFGDLIDLISMLGTIWMEAFGGSQIKNILGAATAAMALVTVLGLFPSLITAIGVASSWLWRMFIVPAAVIAAILLVEDLITALLGGDSVIAQTAKKDGVLGALAATLLMAGEAFAFLGHAISALVSGDLGLLGIYWDDFTKKFSDAFPNLVKAFSRVATWWDTFLSNLAARFGMVFSGAKDTASLNFSEAGLKFATALNMPILPTNQQMNPQQYSTVPTMISNNPIINIQVDGSNPVDAEKIVTKALNNSYIMLEQKQSSDHQRNLVNFPMVGG